MQPFFAIVLGLFTSHISSLFHLDLISLKCAYANDYCETPLRTILLLTLLNKTETCLKNVLISMQILCNCLRLFTLTNLLSVSFVFQQK